MTKAHEGRPMASSNQLTVWSSLLIRNASVRCSETTSLAACRESRRLALGTLWLLFLPPPPPFNHHHVDSFSSLLWGALSRGSSPVRPVPFDAASGSSLETRHQVARSPVTRAATEPAACSRSVVSEFDVHARSTSATRWKRCCSSANAGTILLSGP